MNKAMPFIYPSEKPAPIRIVMRDGEPWFVATDLARILGFRDAVNAVRGLDDDEKATQNLSTSHNNVVQQTLIVSESGLYALILRSRRPSARRFRKWVTAEVLPSIRKTGQWAQPQFDLAKIVAFLHPHQLRVFEAIRGIGANGRTSAPVARIASIAGLSCDTTYRHIALLSLLGVVAVRRHDDRLQVMLELPVDPSTGPDRAGG